MYATGDAVVVTIGTRCAAFTDELWLCTRGTILPGPNGTYIGSNADEGLVVNLGVFAAGTELVFKLYVHDIPLNITPTFFLGPADRNPDSRYHAQIDFDAPGLAANEAFMEFEDFIDQDPFTVAWDHPWGGPAEPDYNDCRFKLSGVGRSPVPEPSTMYLLGCGLIGLVGYGRKKLSMREKKS
ncbi:MAG: PEP-CTERM sorting domain-containing protein [bacterium]